MLIAVAASHFNINMDNMMFKTILLHQYWGIDFSLSMLQSIGGNNNCHFESTTSITELFLMFPRLFSEESDIKRFKNLKFF